MEQKSWALFRARVYGVLPSKCLEGGVKLKPLTLKEFKRLFCLASELRDRETLHDLETRYRVDDHGAAVLSENNQPAHSVSRSGGFPFLFVCFSLALLFLVGCVTAPRVYRQEQFSSRGEYLRFCDHYFLARRDICVTP